MTRVGGTLYIVSGSKLMLRGYKLAVIAYIIKHIWQSFQFEIEPSYPPPLR